MKRAMLATLAAAALLSPLAGTATAQTKTLTGDKQTATATIEAIDHSARTVTLKKENGEYVVVDVPTSVTRFDAMKVGDKLTVTYYDNIVLRLKAPGEKAVDSATADLTRSATAKPGGTVGAQRTITATITQIDQKVPSITFSGPNGWKYSSKVEDKEALAKVKVGDRIDITWTEALLISVAEPAAKK